MYKHNSTGSVITESEYNALSPSKQANYTKENEAGNLSFMSDGHLGLNLGNGLSLDLADGNLGINIGGGFSIDL